MPTRATFHPETGSLSNRAGLSGFLCVNSPGMVLGLPSRRDMTLCGAQLSYFQATSILSEQSQTACRRTGHARLPSARMQAEFRSCSRVRLTKSCISPQGRVRTLSVDLTGSGGLRIETERACNTRKQNKCLIYALAGSSGHLSASQRHSAFVHLCAAMYACAFINCMPL